MQLTKYNSEQLLLTKELSVFEFRDLAASILKNYFDGKIDHFVFDIETQGLNILQKNCNLIGFSLADPINKIGYFIGYSHPDIYLSDNEKSLILGCLFKLLYTIPVVGHNIIFDLSYLTFQFQLDMSRVRILDDTLFLAYYIYGTKRDTGISLSLKNIFRYVFDVDLNWEEELQKVLNSHRKKIDRHFYNVPYNIIAKYGAYDSIATYYLRSGLLEKVKDRVLTAYHYLLKSIHVFVELETTGLAIDWDFRDYLKECYSKKIQKFEEKIQNEELIQKWKETNFTEFNLNSTKMVGQLLYSKDYYNCPVLLTTPKGSPSTNEEALLKLVDPKLDNISPEAKNFCNELLENRNSVKMVSTYLEPLDERRIGDMYSPDYNLIGTSTGRLCFVGETKISLLDGTEKRLDELEKDSEFYVYSCEENSGKIVPTKAVSLGLTKYVTELIEVTLDNGLSERCTPDHKWLLRNGTYKEAQYLKEGDSLMPLYLRDSRFKAKNHKVSFINKLEFVDPIPVYDISILDGPNNFALSSGVIVANSSYFHTLPSGNDVKRMITSRFKNEGGLIISSDFAQIEVKTICFISKDEKLKEAYIKGYDIHSYVASIMFKTSPELVSKTQRKFSKQIVFGILYGKGSFGLSNDLGISREEAQKLVDFFFLGFPSIKSWIDSQHKFLKKNKFVQTNFGRRRYLRDIDSPEWKKVAEAQRAAQNTPIQSTASDIVLCSTLKIYEELKTRNFKSKLIGTVHDSIQVDTHPDELFEVLNIVKHTMNEGVTERHDFLNGVPITADIELGTSWGGACSLEKFNEKLWVIKGYRLDAENLIERLKLSKNFKYSEFMEVEENEDNIIKFVDPGKKVKFKIIW